ncbi:hypothetical protein ACFFX0_22670 [Citricoccus parietis]|uniref:Uncharacterized protein n=1 Tax=Citricoccus parietis TaxID=592307 RepID=A0ABV5G4H7_9MICC
MSWVSAFRSRTNTCRIALTQSRSSSTHSETTPPPPVGRHRRVSSPYLRGRQPASAAGSPGL